MSAATGKSFGEKMGDWFRATFGCCAGYDDGDEEERPALQIVSLVYDWDEGEGEEY